MNTPFPAVLIERFHAPFHAVVFRPCVVVSLLPESKQAIVEFRTRKEGPQVSRVAPYADLASDAEKAAALFAAESARVIEKTFTSATDEKSAVQTPDAARTQKMAGAVAE